MNKLILCFSLNLVQSCATNNHSKNLLGIHAEESYPENYRIMPKRLPIYLYSHTNSLGDQVAGTWIRVEDPR